MITEIAVAEMGIQVVHHVHLVAVDVVEEAHITAAEGITTGRIHLTMILPNGGIQVARKGLMDGAVSQVLKFKTHQVGKLSPVVGALLEPKVEVVVTIMVVVGAKQVLLLMTMGVLAGDLFPKAAVVPVVAGEALEFLFIHFYFIQGIAVDQL